MEILFRAKKCGSNEWVYGLPIKLVEDDDECNGMQVGFENVDIYPATLTPYIGCEDKGGNKLFEGDVVIWSGHHGCIAYDAPAFKWINKLDGASETLDYNDYSACEKIGDIFNI